MGKWNCFKLNGTFLPLFCAQNQIFSENTFAIKLSVASLDQIYGQKEELRDLEFR